ncbi:hypothetical protein QTP88_011120 [Uroleucon formosanum]
MTYVVYGILRERAAIIAVESNDDDDDDDEVDDEWELQLSGGTESMKNRRRLLLQLTTAIIPVAIFPLPSYVIFYYLLYALHYSASPLSCVHDEE